VRRSSNQADLLRLLNKCPRTWEAACIEVVGFAQLTLELPQVSTGCIELAA